MSLSTREVNNSVNGAVAIYNPNGAAAMAAAIIFAILAVAAWNRYYKTKPRAKWTRYLCLGSTFMCIGFICRFTRRNGINAWSWLFETLLILLSPCLFLAQDYVLVPRIAQHLAADDLLILPRRTIVILYVLCDILTVLAQLAGTALTITFGDLVSIGVKLVTAGLWVQFACFASFILVYTMLGVRIRRHYELQIKSQIGSKFKNPRAVYFAVGTSCLLLLIRSIYRVAEYTAGANSPLGQSEIAFYLCDSLMMAINVLIFVVVWPPTALSPVIPSETMLSMT